MLRLAVLFGEGGASALVRGIPARSRRANLKFKAVFMGPRTRSQSVVVRLSERDRSFLDALQGECVAVAAPPGLRRNPPLNVFNTIVREETGRVHTCSHGT